MDLKCALRCHIHIISLFRAMPVYKHTHYTQTQTQTQTHTHTHTHTLSYHLRIANRRGEKWTWSIIIMVHSFVHSQSCNPFNSDESLPFLSEVNLAIHSTIMKVYSFVQVKLPVHSTIMKVYSFVQVNLAINSTIMKVYSFVQVKLAINSTTTKTESCPPSIKSLQCMQLSRFTFASSQACHTVDMVHGCMVYTECAELDGSSFTWHQPCQHCKYTPLVGIQKRAIKNLHNSFLNNN